MAKTAKAAAKAVEKASVDTVKIPADDSSLKQVFKVTEKMTEEIILKYASAPGVELEFDVVYFRELDESFVALLPPSAQKAYWVAHTEFESRVRQANIAQHSISVDPSTKLLDGPRGAANPLVRDQKEISTLMPEYYVTWRIQGGQGDLENAIRAGFKVMRKPKDEEERKTKPPAEWNGEIWRIRDGIADPRSGEEIYNVMVFIRKGAWKDNIDAISMISHNAYAQNKKQFVEGVDNMNRDMSSSKERIAVVDLDETHVEEHTIVEGGKRVRMDSQK